MSLVELRVVEFAKELASDSPAPGGGSVAALAGALSSALCTMVARLTLGRERYRDVWGGMEEVRTSCEELTSKLLHLVDLDTDAYNQVTSAFKLPRQTAEEKAARDEAIQEATKRAAMIPLETLKTVAALSDFVRPVLEKGNSNCVTDAGVAAQLIRAAAAGAAYNVRINLSGLQDRELAEELSRKTSELFKKTSEVVAELEEMVEKRLGI